ncbi:hypothetical protein CEXT_84431 [Caerostris extrusa]|uniref:Uncharacterized protein n=1 Tax=Caerostris extrusa TaxID=172846 RepID=A0AAV4MPW2_CAEEX|nr:hypothetical protein CEXT_84431 [Caerostris extrusa]
MRRLLFPEPVTFPSGTRKDEGRSERCGNRIHILCFPFLCRKIDQAQVDVHNSTPILRRHVIDVHPLMDQVLRMGPLETHKGPRLLCFLARNDGWRTLF